MVLNTNGNIIIIAKMLSDAQCYAQFEGLFVVGHRPELSVIFLSVRFCLGASISPA